MNAPASTVSRPRMLPTLAIVGLMLAPSALLAQGRSTGPVKTQQISGIVLEAGQMVPVPDAVIRVRGEIDATRSGADGRFILRGVPSGSWVLEVRAPGRDPYTYDVALEPGGFAELEIVLEALTPEPATSAVRSMGVVAEGELLDDLRRGARDIGQLVQLAVPGLSGAQVSNLAGGDRCISFRGGARSSAGSVGASGCTPPLVYLDGAPLSNPDVLFSSPAVNTVMRIQAIAPDEASVAFGGAMDGVVLLETGTGADGVQAGRRIAPRRPRRTSFDWSQDPQGHNFARTFLGAAAGNALGLAAGLAVGEQCVFVEERTDEIDFKCNNAGVAGAGLAAVTLPAIGGALGAQFAGRTTLSKGRVLPAVIGGAMGVLPGYIFSLSTVGGGVQTMNAVGVTFLLVGAPVITTFADRIFRSLR